MASANVSGQAYAFMAMTPVEPGEEMPLAEYLGEELPEGGTKDDGADRGLVFVSVHGSISRQFEGVQVQRLNAGNIFGTATTRTFCSATRTGRAR
ncbi:MAG TPA: hypothetical protein VNA28_02010 [Solirubrobacteraceae bacterium]|nr:hypothetical protein [Solirubrobacteraceae bacterium]